MFVPLTGKAEIYPNYPHGGQRYRDLDLFEDRDKIRWNIIGRHGAGWGRFYDSMISMCFLYAWREYKLFVSKVYGGPVEKEAMVKLWKIMLERCGEKRLPSMQKQYDLLMEGCNDE